MKSALTIAGSDPTGGAGLPADLRVFRAFGVHGLSVPSALTAQNTEGVDLVEPVQREFFRRQLEFLLDDIRPDALKTGMLYSAGVVEETAGVVSSRSLRNLVVDPVAASSSGRSLVEEGALDAIRDRLFPLARIITPNIYEAALLTGINSEAAEMEAVARALKEMGPEVVIVTGGHMEKTTIDLFFDGRKFHRIEGRKIEGDFHGTGCAFSSALAALLALGRPPLEAAREARNFIQEAILKSYRLGRGMGLLAT
ncbi:MAG: bifunctional hydroxymethylpyrimidine kinase/phosphomethylpyrimidine kinase [Thermodesulfovibrionales bacterium]